MSLPRANYDRLASNISVTIEYLKPLLKSSRLRTDILNVIYHLARINPCIETFYSLVDLYRDFPELVEEIFTLIGYIFRGSGLKVLGFRDIGYLIDSCRPSDLADAIKVIGLIFENTPNLRIAEILFGLADPDNEAVMRAIDFAIVKIFRDPSLLVDNITGELPTLSHPSLRPLFVHWEYPI